MVWPKSGSITNSDTSVINSASAIEVAGISGRPRRFRKQPRRQHHEGGLRGLGGLDVDTEQRDPAPRALHLRADQQRRHDQRDRDREYDQRAAADLPRRQERHAIITMNDGSKKSTWRLKKWNGSSPILVATGGLAASDRMTPASISAMIAASCRRSTVHHHSLRGVRCSREIMGIPFGRRARLLVAEDGFQGVNGIVMFWMGLAVMPRERGHPVCSDLSLPLTTL